MSPSGTTTSRAIPALGDVRVFDAQPILGEDASWRTLA